jgi:hypothetical protein
MVTMLRHRLIVEKHRETRAAIEMKEELAEVGGRQSFHIAEGDRIRASPSWKKRGNGGAKAEAAGGGGVQGFFGKYASLRNGNRGSPSTRWTRFGTVECRPGDHRQAKPSPQKPRRIEVRPSPRHPTNRAVPPSAGVVATCCRPPW